MKMTEIQLSVKVGDDGRAIDYVIDTKLSVIELKTIVIHGIREAMEKNKNISEYRRGRIDE